MKSKPKVLFILGPTGVGKTAMGVELAKTYNGQIISADSVQVFRGFDIGSAKVTEEEMQGVYHYGIDIVQPDQDFSASEFVSYTKNCIKEITQNGKLPIIVGGTAMYVKALVEGYNFGGTEKHTEFRAQMQKFIQENGNDKAFEFLAQKSPELAKNTDKFNTVRLIRALEIANFGDGKHKNEEVEFDFKIFALTMPREKMYDKINRRAKIMVDNGLVEEVSSLYKKYGNCQPMYAIGYKEVLPYLNGEISLQQMQDLISQHTRNYAKRQMTFLRGMKNVSMVDVSVEAEIEMMKKEIEKWLMQQ